MSNRNHAVRTAMARSHLYIIKTPARKASALRAGVCNYSIKFICERSTYQQGCYHCSWPGKYNRKYFG